MSYTQKVDPGAPLLEGEFRRIKGIAETTERALHVAGIKTFEQLAILNPEEIAAVLSGNVGIKERASRQDWMGQAANYARLLAEQNHPEFLPGGLPSGAKEKGESQPKRQQHYASFMMVLLMDEEQNVRRTTVTHIQDETRESWAGWEPQRMTDWIAEQAEISSARLAEMPEKGKVLQRPAEKRSAEKPVHGLTGSLLASPVVLSGPASRGIIHEILSGDPFTAGLTLNLSQVKPMPGKGPDLQYHAEARLRPLANGGQSRAVQTEGKMQAGENLELTFSLPGLPEGAYHMEIAVLVAPEGSTNPAEEGLGALSEGLMVRVQTRKPVTSGASAD